MASSLVFACGVGLLGIWLCGNGRRLWWCWEQTNNLDTGSPLPQCVRVWRAGSEIEVSIATLQVGDRMIVQSGEIIPVDGVIVAGTAWVDTSPAGGNCKQVKKIHQRVCAEHLVLAGSILIEIESNSKGE